MYSFLRDYFLNYDTNNIRNQGGGIFSYLTAALFWLIEPGDQS